MFLAIRFKFRFRNRFYQKFGKEFKHRNVNQIRRVLTYQGLVYRRLKATNPKLGGILVAFLTKYNKCQQFSDKLEAFMNIMLGF